MALVLAIFLPPVSVLSVCLHVFAGCFCVLALCMGLELAQRSLHGGCMLAACLQYACCVSAACLQQHMLAMMVVVRHVCVCSMLAHPLWFKDYIL